MSCHSLPQASQQQRDVLAKMEAMDRLLQLPETASYIEKQAEKEGYQDDCSVRHINGGRFEIFVRSEGHKSEGYEYLQAQLQPKDRMSAEDYEKYIKEAVPGVGDDHRFAAFSIVVSYQKSKPQNVHIDLIGRQNRQYILLLSNNSPSTQFSMNQINPKRLRDVWLDAPASLAKEVDTDEWASEKIRHFGAVLADNIQLSKVEKMPRGTVFCLSGHHAHCAPQSNKFRAILFCSSCPGNNDNNNNDSAEPEYNSNDQWSSASLCCSLVNWLWDILDIPSRKYILQKTAKATIQESQRSCVTDSFESYYCYDMDTDTNTTITTTTPLVSFLKHLEDLALKNTQQSQAQLQKILANLDKQARNDKFTDPV